MLQNFSVSMSYSQVYKDHGIYATIQGQKQPNTHLHSKHIEFDIQGPIFKCLGPGLSTLAQLLLPFRLQRFPYDSLSKNKTNITCKFGIGIKRLSHTVLDSTLDKAIKQGDPAFKIELIDDYTETICSFISKASLIKKSLKDGTNIVYKGKDANNLKFGGKNIWLGFIRWWFFAWMFLAIILGLYFQPDKISKGYPIKFFSGIEAANRSYIQELPPFPSNFEQAYEYGYLTASIQNAEEDEKQKVLQQAAEIAQRDKVSEEELNGIKEEIIVFQKKKGIVQRIRGFFTFINIVWLGSIIGIAVSIGPCMYDLLKPIRQYLKQFLIKLWKKIIVPFCEMIHNRGILEFCFYYISSYFVVEGFRINKEIGYFVVLTGMALVIPSYLYSCLRHLKKLRMKKSPDNIVKMATTWIAVCFAFLAIQFQAPTFGFVTVASLYYILMDNSLIKQFCTYIGFDNNNPFHRVIIVSSILIIIYSLLYFSNFDDSILQPFDQAINFIGTLALFWALLLNSSYWLGYDWNKFIQQQILFWVFLLAALFIGSLYANMEILNLAITFAVFYLIEKYTEIHFEYRFSGWIYAFMLSVVLWRMALWCHLHPNFLVSIFQSFNHNH